MRLYVLRHAKAHRDSDSGRDQDRPLAPHGEAQARTLAEIFSSPVPPEPLAARPELILSSPALRATTTAEIIGNALGIAVRHDGALGLDSTQQRVLDLVETLVEQHQSVLIVGHNPALSRLVERLAGAAELRTGELSVIELDASLDGRELARFREDD